MSQPATATAIPTKRRRPRLDRPGQARHAGFHEERTAAGRPRWPPLSRRWGTRRVIGRAQAADLNGHKVASNVSAGAPGIGHFLARACGSSTTVDATELAATTAARCRRTLRTARQTEKAWVAESAPVGASRTDVRPFTQGSAAHRRCKGRVARCVGSRLQQAERLRQEFSMIRHRLVLRVAPMGSLPIFGACRVASVHTMKPDAFATTRARRSGSMS